jgi:putative oxidoreductase
MLASPALDARAGRAGVTLLRVSLGTLFLAHSVVLKLLTFTLPGTAAFFESQGLPGWLAYVTFAAEAVGGLALVVGIQARWVALLLSPFLLGALVTVHWANGWVFTAPGGGWEYPAYLFVLCLAQALLGDGAWALKPSTSLDRLLGSRSPLPRLG